MTPVRAYGDEIARTFHLERAPAVSLDLRPGAFFAATSVRGGEEGLGHSLPLAIQSALIVCILRSPLTHELWYGGESVPVVPDLPTGTIAAIDLEREPTAYYGGVLDSLQIYVPRDSFSAMAQDGDVPMVNDLIIPGGTVDDVAHQMSLMLQPAFDNPDQWNVLFVSGLLEAFYGHLVEKYGNVVLARNRRGTGGLTPSQLSRAKDLIEVNLSGDVSLSYLARECGLSPTHFARAFKQSVGIPPHRWLLFRRVEKAKSLLEHGTLSVREIASATGFADQSHLIRVFSKIVGITPRAWRVLRRK